MLKEEKMFPVGTGEIKPLDEKKAREARNYSGSKINETTPEGIPVYLTPRPPDMNKQIQQQNKTDFDQAQEIRGKIGDL